jgi:outer membrane protein TolC
VEPQSSFAGRLSEFYSVRILQYQAGIANDEAVAAAETQLETAQVQDTNLGTLRAQNEHAIALLIGQFLGTSRRPRHGTKLDSTLI